MKAVVTIQVQVDEQIYGMNADIENINHKNMKEAVYTLQNNLLKQMEQGKVLPLTSLSNHKGTVGENNYGK